MQTLVTKKVWKYLFWIGPFFVSAGLTAGFVSDDWGPLQLALIISGIVLTGIWVVFQTQQNNWWGRRSTQVSTNAVVATLAVLVILGLINFLATRYYVRMDLTETQLFTLAPQSQQVVRNLPTTAKLWIFAREQNPLDRDLLENYRKQGKLFSFEYVDPQARPGLAEKFGVKDFGEVYLEAQGQRKLVQVLSPTERLSEVKLTNRLQQISNATTPKVYFLQGHGEHPLTPGDRGISQAVNALTDKNYITEPLNLTKKVKVPEDAAVVVVSGPQRALFDSEVKALQDYLNQGGNAMLMIDPNTDPKLDPLLTEWGVSLDPRLAVDISGGVGLGPAVPLVNQYGEHPITKDFRDGISFYRLARPVDTRSVPGVKATPLLFTKPYPESWAESDLQSEKLEFNSDKDRRGPLTLGVALSRQIEVKSTATPTPTPTASPTPGTTPSLSQPIPLPTTLPTPGNTAPAPPKPEKTQKESRLVVLGNSDFSTDGLFEQQLNGDVFLNSVAWLSQQDTQPLSIRPKQAKNRRMNISATEASLLTWSAMGFLPLIGFGGAGILWWRRR